MWTAPVLFVVNVAPSASTIRLHDLRHTHASQLLAAGVPVHVVSQRLGHRDPAFTLRIYAHFLPRQQRDAAELVAGLVAGTNGSV